MNQIEQTPLREIDLSHYIRHYSGLLWRWRWWILTTGPIVSAIVLIYLAKFVPDLPIQEARVMIGLENTTSMSAVLNIGEPPSSKAEIIRTRPFLRTIVDKLSFQLALNKYPRNEIFDTVAVDSTALLGKYDFVLDRKNVGNYALLYTNKRMGKNKETVVSGKLSNLTSILLPGIRFKLKPAFLREPHNFSFGIMDVRRAIEVLRGGIILKVPDVRRGISNIEISMKGRDYRFIAAILNTIGNAFVEKKLQFSKKRTQNMLEVLEKQYIKSKSELDIAEARLRGFRTSNPTVGLTQSAQQTLNSIVQMETSVYSIKNTVDQARELQTKYSRAFQEDIVSIAEEILVFLNIQRSTSAPVLQMELNRLSAELRSLEGSYMSNHPLIAAKKSEIAKVVEKISNELTSFINKAENESLQTSFNLQSTSAKLQTIPSKELQLADLQRQHQVNSQIYSAILDRYNQAKVSEVIEVADVYILDYAVPPIPPPTDTLQMFAICLALGLLFAFTPPIIFDMFNKTVRTEFELRRITNLIVFEAIPEIIPTKAKTESRSDHETNK